VFCKNHEFFFLGENDVKNKKEIPLEGYKCPSKEVDSENFLENRDIINLLETKDSYKFKKEYELRLLDCVHCNECLTSEERCQLNHKFLEDGNKIEGLDEMVSMSQVHFKNLMNVKNTT